MAGSGDSTYSWPQSDLTSAEHSTIEDGGLKTAVVVFFIGLVVLWMSRDGGNEPISIVDSGVNILCARWKDFCMNLATVLFQRA